MISDRVMRGPNVIRFDRYTYLNTIFISSTPEFKEIQFEVSKKVMSWIRYPPLFLSLCSSYSTTTNLHKTNSNKPAILSSISGRIQFSIILGVAALVLACSYRFFHNLRPAESYITHHFWLIVSVHHPSCCCPIGGLKLSLSMFVRTHDHGRLPDPQHLRHQDWSHY